MGAPKKIIKSFTNSFTNISKNLGKYKYPAFIILNIILINAIKDTDMPITTIKSFTAASAGLFSFLIILDLPIPFKIGNTTLTVGQHSKIKIARLILAILYPSILSAVLFTGINDVESAKKHASNIITFHQFATIFLYAFFGVFRRFKTNFGVVDIVIFKFILVFILSINQTGKQHKKKLGIENTIDYLKKIKLNTGFKFMYTILLLVSLFTGLFFHTNTKNYSIFGLILLIASSIFYLYYSFKGILDSINRASSYESAEKELQESKLDIDRQESEQKQKQILNIRKMQDFFIATKGANQISTKIPLLFFLLSLSFFIIINYKLKIDSKFSILSILIFLGYFLLYLAGAKQRFSNEEENYTDLYSLKNSSYTGLLVSGIVFLSISFIGFSFFGLYKNNSAHLKLNKGVYGGAFLLLSTGAAALSYFYGDETIRRSYEPFKDYFLLGKKVKNNLVALKPPSNTILTDATVIIPSDYSPPPNQIIRNLENNNEISRNINNPSNTPSSYNNEINSIKRLIPEIIFPPTENQVSEEENFIFIRPIVDNENVFKLNKRQAGGSDDNTYLNFELIDFFNNESTNPDNKKKINDFINKLRNIYGFSDAEINSIDTIKYFEDAEDLYPNIYIKNEYRKYFKFFNKNNVEILPDYYKNVGGQNIFYNIPYQNYKRQLLLDINNNISTRSRDNENYNVTSKFANNFGFGFIITVVISLFFGIGLFFGYEVIFDKFKISELRISESNVFPLVISSILVPLIFQIIHALIYSVNSISANINNIWSSTINLALVSLYILSTSIPGYKYKIIAFGLVAIINSSLFTIPGLVDTKLSIISLYITLFIVMFFAIKNSITPGDKHDEIIKIILWATFIISIFHSGPQIFSKIILNEDPAFTEDIVDVGNNTWPALIIGVVIAIIIERYIMNPYIVTKIPFTPTKEDFFAKELHKQFR